MDGLLTAVLLVLGLLGAASIGVWIGRWIGWRQGYDEGAKRRGCPQPLPAPVIKCARCRRKTQIAQLERMLTL